MIGHDSQRERLCSLISRGIMAHSSLLVGPRGIGKSLVARELAQALLCDNCKDGIACNDCESCRLLKSGNHPDFYFIECESENFNAEQTRELLYSINLAPYRAKKRVIIFNDADSLSVVVANLLLKTLEEPRQDTFFFLIAANASRLPIPVVSRCQTWRFARLNADEIREALSSIENLALIEDLVELANGSLENIKDIESFIPLWESTKEKVGFILEGDSYLAMNYAAHLSKDKEQIPNHLAMIRLYLSSKLALEEQPARQLILADGLENMLIAERLITERNLAPLSVLNLCMLGLSGTLPAQGRLIGDIVV